MDGHRRLHCSKDHGMPAFVDSLVSVHVGDNSSRQLHD